MKEVFDIPGWAEIDAIFMATILGFARLQAFFYMSPFFGARGMPRTIRLGLMVALALFMAPATVAGFGSSPELADRFLSLVLKEVVLGFFLGLLTWLPLRGFELTGVILDTQRGSTIAQDYDVIFNAQTTPTAIFLSQIFSGYFFAAGGFLVVQTTVFNSLEFWPPLAVFPALQSEGLLIFLEFGGQLFFTAVAVSLPIVAFMLLADIAIAFLAKTAPTLNALTFGMPVKSAVLMIMLIFYIDIAYPKVFLMFQEGSEILKRVFEP